MLRKFRAITQVLLIPLGPWNTKIKVLCVRILVIQNVPGSWSSLFYFRKKHIWTYSSKIKVPQFPYCQYVSVYVCTLATANTVWANKLKLEPGSLQMIMSKCIFYLFEILFFWEDMPLSSILMHTTGEKGSNTCFDMWSIIIKGS